MGQIKISGLNKSYTLKNESEKLQVIDNLSLNIKDGEFVTLFGPNGSGKTTLLKIIAGTEKYDSGTVTINSKLPDEAKTGFIFQNYNDSLLPWLTCKENILFPFNLKKNRSEKKGKSKELDDLINQINFDIPLDRYPYQMSGGEKQMTSILRTLIYNPEVILMDEPFNSLDHSTRRMLQRILLKIWRMKEMTILFISHDIEEAIYLADRVFLLNPLPTSIKSVKEVPFQRPRDLEIVKSKDFFLYKNELLEQVDTT